MVDSWEVKIQHETQICYDRTWRRGRFLKVTTGHYRYNKIVLLTFEYYPDSRLTDSPLKFIKVCGFASITGTSPIKPAIGNQLLS